MPAGRWVRAGVGQQAFGFASNALYSFDLAKGSLRATVVRAAHFAKTSCASDRDKRSGTAAPWRSVMDQGALSFQFVLNPGEEELVRLAYELEQPLVSLPVPARKAEWRRSGSLAELMPSGLRLLALKPAENGKGWILRVQEGAGKAAEGRLIWLGKPLKLGRISPNAIATFRLTQAGKGWRCEATTLVEEPCR